MANEQDGKIPSIIARLLKENSEKRKAILSGLPEDEQIRTYQFIAEMSYSSSTMQGLALDLEELMIIQRFLSGEQSEPEHTELKSDLSPEKIPSIEETLKILEEKRRNKHLAYRLYRRIIPKKEKSL